MSGNEKEVKNEEIEDPNVEEEETTENQEQNEDVSDSEKQEDEEEEVIEKWMSSEEDEAEQTSDSDSGTNPDAVPVGKHVSMKHKLRGQISERDSKIDKLEQEIEALKNNTVTRETKKDLVFPRIEQYDYDEDKYNKAVDDYIQQKADITINKVVSERDQKLNVQKRYEQQSAELNSHLNRVDKLIQKTKITEEDYSKAEISVRSAVEKVAPGRGNFITETLIAAVGEGSEKLMYYMGRNRQAVNKLQNLLRNDPTGLSAVAYLGKQVKTLENPIKMKTKAPAPGKNVKGDLSYSGSAKSLKREYDKAHKIGNVQKAFDLKAEAKKNGVDTSSW